MGTRCEDVPKGKSAQGRMGSDEEPAVFASAAKRQIRRKKQAGGEEFGASAEAIRAMIAASWPEIVEGLIEKAREGNYQHAKLLLEFFAQVQTAGDTNQEEREELCDALLRNLSWSGNTTSQPRQTEAARKNPEEMETR